MRLTEVEVKSSVHGTMVIEPCFDANAINCVGVDIISGEQFPVSQYNTVSSVDFSGLIEAVHMALEYVMSDKMVISERGALCWCPAKVALTIPNANAILSPDTTCFARTSHV
ncbi:hypothetical protein [Shewanella colwelliana]|uniref:hypothetical protein n=1 Tax=Shewanella colwelliana TaxID=23 RepID=UPI00299E963C|nr:hypothetical protein [Shewanella colwelliana]MDX1282762.1 hypothetical protein [Shewanella colwelliana]